MNDIGIYRKVRFTKFRRLIEDGLEMGRKKHTVKGLIELDVTAAREAIRQYRRIHNVRVSFLSWFITCIGKALQDYPELNAMRKRNRIIVFDDIDMSVAMELSLEGEMVPKLLVLRRIQDKSMELINEEIESFQKANRASGTIMRSEEKKRVVGVWFLLSLPRFLRMALWRILLRNPFYVKRMMGTAGLTAVGMFGNIHGWPIPLPSTNHAVSFALGSIVPKVRMIRGKGLERQILHMTVLFDHDIIDGAPASRFINHLKKLVESGYQII